MNAAGIPYEVIGHTIKVFDERRQVLAPVRDEIAGKGIIPGRMAEYLRYDRVAPPCEEVRPEVDQDLSPVLSFAVTSRSRDSVGRMVLAWNSGKRIATAVPQTADPPKMTNCRLSLRDVCSATVSQDPTIAVVGAGAIGGYYGAMLARAGADVRFLLRRDLIYVRENGLRVWQPPDGDFTLRRPRVSGTTAGIGPVELVIIGLKATANECLPDLLPPLLRPDTALLLLQNGLGGDAFLARHFGPERVIGGLCFVCLNRTAPGEITCTLPGYLSLGEFAGPPTDRLRALAARFARSGVTTEIAENLDEARWRKLVWNVPFNGLTIAAGGVTTDVIMNDPALRSEARALMEEIVEAAARLGYRIPTEFLDEQMARTASMGAYRPSSLIDWQEGREVEVEAIWGEPLRRAQAAGAVVPRLEALYRRLQALTSPRAMSSNS